jgi:hypothetical protein
VAIFAPVLRALLLAVVVVAAGIAVVASVADSAPAHTTWLCRPGAVADPCATSRTTTVVDATGHRRVERFPGQRNPRVDCFYVYPTVSQQATLNADHAVEDAERIAARLQASRFSSVCRVYAPIYRQLTVRGLSAPAGPRRSAADTAYADVLAAWRDYLAHDNHGRGVVLIGHSQGTGMLTRLVAEQIDPDPLVRRRLVSALLIGGNVLVPAGRDVGGTFQHVPACRTTTQTGCVVAYSSFLHRPPDPSFFARGPASAYARIFATNAHGRDLQTLCVNPAAPAGGAGTLDPFFRVDDAWVAYPGRYRARCTSAGGASWLQVDPVAHDARPIATSARPTWGLHGADVNLTLGNLVALVRSESAAYVR